jgi:hypothetical protein
VRWTHAGFALGVEDELASDVYPVELVDDVILKFTTKVKDLFATGTEIEPIFMMET